jgi:hypothetical protein
VYRSAARPVPTVAATEPSGDSDWLRTALVVLGIAAVLAAGTVVWSRA